MLPSLWEDTCTFGTDRLAYAHTFPSLWGPRVCWVRHSGQMPVWNTAGADLVACGHLACDPVLSSALFPSHHAFARVSREAGTLDAWFPGYKTMASGTYLSSMRSCPHLGEERNRGLLYKKPLFHCPQVRPGTGNPDGTPSLSPREASCSFP